MKRYTLLIGICIAVLVFAGAVWIPRSGEAASPVIETHHYYPVGEASESGNHSNACQGGSCELMSLAKGGEDEVVTSVNAEVKDVSITTEERDKCVEAGNLESTIIERAGASFSDSGEGSSASGFAVTGVSGADTVKYLEPKDGFVGCTVKLRISGGGISSGFIETNVYVTYVQDDSENQKKDEDENDRNDQKEDGSGSDQNISVNDGTDDDGDDFDDGDDDGGDGISLSPKKKPVDKEKKDKQTAQITAKEREKDTAIAVAPGSEDEGGSGPDPITVSLFALAAAAAAVFGRWIRSDLRIIRWHEQKKALRKP